MKLYDKEINKKVEEFTVGKDYILDQELVEYDCKASKAHAKMLLKTRVLSKKEYNDICKVLDKIIELSGKGEFEILQSDEDCHTAIENYLVSKLGDTGKKIHSFRSRNDQVLTAMKLYEKTELGKMLELVDKLCEVLDKKIFQNKGVKMPGYTHMQKAMPTTVENWLGSFKEALKDDKTILQSVLKVIDKNPLGSAAGFGVPVFNIDKSITTEELGFSKSIKYPLHAQISRGKDESLIINSLSQIMLVLNKIATDLTMFNMKEFGYVELPKKYCTGSSIMPQKNNPDVLELIRGKYHIVLGEEFKVKSLIGNLMSGYNRDLQLTKEPLMNSFEITKKSIDIMTLVVEGMKIEKDKCSAGITDEMLATEKAYKLVKEGMPFREAYKKVSKEFD